MDRSMGVLWRRWWGPSDWREKREEKEDDGDEVNSLARSLQASEAKEGE
jgi:hypothetical protein